MDARRMCHDLQRSMGALFTCSEQGGHLRIRTPFLYPDGDNIDIFCKVVDDTVTVSDLAETTVGFEFNRQPCAGLRSRRGS